MKKKFNIGDLVRYDARTRARGLCPHSGPWFNEIGVVIANDIVRGIVVSFPSKTTACSALSIELAQ